MNHKPAMQKQNQRISLRVFFVERRKLLIRDIRETSRIPSPLVVGPSKNGVVVSTPIVWVINREVC